MDAIWTQEDIQHAISVVGEKASTDKQFRTLALSNPHEAIKQATGKEVPAHYRLTMIEGDPAFDLTLVLPNLQTDELSDTELDQVAGGRSCNDQCTDLRHCDVY